MILLKHKVLRDHERIDAKMFLIRGLSFQTEVHKHFFSERMGYYLNSLSQRIGSLEVFIDELYKFLKHQGIEKGT